MEVTQYISFAIGLIGFMAVLVAAFIVAKSSATKQTITTQNDLINALSTKVQILEKEVLRLSSEVEVVRDLPLKDIASNQAKIVKTQEEIIKIIKEK